MTLSNISAFLQNPDKKGMVDVYADGELVITLSEDTVIEASLKIGQPLDVETLEKIETAAHITKAKKKAYNFLSYGDMSAHTLKTKLMRAGFSDDICDAVVSDLTAAGYIDDMRYACAYAKSLAEYKHYGARRISQELYVKGVDSETAAYAVDSLDTDFEQSILACIPKNTDYADRKQMSKLYAALIRRGFDYDTVSDVLGRLINDTEDF